MKTSQHEQIIENVVKAHYRKLLMNNVHRAHYVEAMISLALDERWRLVSRDWDWAPWDLESDDGVRLEVKQSAAVQSWNTHDPQENRSFDIAQRNGYWDYESRWHAGKARYADIYLFAWHPELNRKIADHRCPEQWLFFVIPEYGLPAQKSISLNSLKKNPATVETVYEGLAATVEAIAAALPELKRTC